ncbi:MAG: hypothetical protein R3240_08775 [Gammaproteobacteria bacterium]|nr:hypothetical protein [Gammaproteobacteria bacterium]
MVSTTLTGLVFPWFTPGQMPQYWNKPVAFIDDLATMRVSPQYSSAVIQHIEKVTQEHQEFVSQMIEISTWYEPPKGTHVDTWA